MKKIVLLFLFTTVFTLSACTKEQEEVIIEETNAPANVLLDDGVVSFDAITQAIAYEYEITQGDDLTIYEFSNAYDMNYLLENGEYTLRLRARFDVNSAEEYTEYTEPFTLTIEHSLKRMSIYTTNLNSEKYIHYSGRTMYDETLQARTLYYTGSGFDVRFYGTTLTVRINAEQFDSSTRRPYIMVFVDGEYNPLLGDTYALDEEENTITLVEGLAEGFHTVTVYKRSESLDSNISLRKVETDGFFVDPTIERQLNIQFIGASTTTGYGNMATSATTAKTTENSNGMLAFTYLTAYMLNADFSITSASGWGISRGWNTGGKIDEVRNIPNAYRMTAITSTGAVLDSVWDQSQFVPDVYVVNLGSNDYNTSNYAMMSAEDKAAFEQTFVDDYRDFLISLHYYNPDATIIVVYGILSKLDVVERLTLQAVNEAKEVHNQTFAIELQNGAELGFGYGANYHPSKETHHAAADTLVDYIEYFTDFEEINPNVTLPE